MSGQDHIHCPSSRCKPGSELIGVRQDDGTVAILPTPLPVDKTFIEKVSHVSEAPEERFRFSNKCVESGCTQWTGSRCGVIDKFTGLFENLPSRAALGETRSTTAAAEENLPVCAIRPSCRWFLQSGPGACRACPYILTHVTEVDTLIPQP
jgi:hypothetical protein